MPGYHRGRLLDFGSLGGAYTYLCPTAGGRRRMTASICEGGRSVAEGEIALHSLSNVPEQVLQLVVARQQLEPLLAALVRLAHALHCVQHLGLRPPDLAHTGRL